MSSWAYGNWMNEVYASLGYDWGVTEDRGFAFNNDRRSTHKKDWYFTAFAICNICDADDQFANHWLAFASIFGPWIVTPAQTVGTIELLAEAVMHETLHVFGARDETPGALDCADCELLHGYLRVPNGNCPSPCNENPTSCLMADPFITPHEVCAYTRGHVGWQDSEEVPEGICDPFEQPACTTSLRLIGGDLVAGDYADIYRLVNGNRYWAKRIAFSDWTLDAGDGLWDGFDYQGLPCTPGSFQWSKNGGTEYQTTDLLTEQDPPQITDARLVGNPPHLRLRFEDDDTHCGRVRVTVRPGQPPDTIAVADRYFLETPVGEPEIDLPLGPVPNLSAIEVRVWDTGGGREDTGSVTFLVAGIEPDGSSEETARLGRAAPNPSAGDVRWAVPSTIGSISGVSIYSVDGRRVRDIEVGPAATPVGGIVWDGRDETGRPVPAGRYYLTVRSGSGSKRVGEVTITR